MKQLQEFALDLGYEGWFFVALVFQNQEVFSKMAKTFAINGATTEDGRFRSWLMVTLGRCIHTYIPDSVECTCAQIVKSAISAELCITDWFCRQHGSPTCKSSRLYRVCAMKSSKDAATTT